MGSRRGPKAFISIRRRVGRVAGNDFSGVIRLPVNFWLMLAAMLVATFLPMLAPRRTERRNDVRRTDGDDD